METDTAVDAKAQLARLRDELTQREWLAEFRGTDKKPFLHVCNPADHGFNDSIACVADRFCWNWGPEVGMVDDVPGTADRIQHVLRQVTP